MKSCPICNRTFEDTFTFCLVDGAILSAPYDPQTALSHSGFGTAEPRPTEIFTPTIKATNPIPSLSTQPTPSSSIKQNGHVNNGSGKSRVLIAVIVLLILLSGVIVTASWSGWFSNNNSPAQQSKSENINTNITSPTASSPLPISTPQNSPSPKPTTSLGKKVDITGTWTGMFAGREAILFINNQDGNSFTGILKNTKGAIIAISGRINPDTRQVSIKENRVVEGAKEGPDWILGSNSGALSSDGKQMSGKGKDEAGHGYAWSFTK